MDITTQPHHLASAPSPLSTAQNTVVNGTPTSQKQSKKQDNPPAASRSTTAENIAEAGAAVKLTGAELKKAKAAGKAARRAEKVAEKGATVQQQQTQSQTQAPVQTQGRPPLQQRRLSSGRKENEPHSHHRRSGSSTGKQLPLRNVPTTEPSKAAPEKVADDKRVSIFAHLYPREAKATISNAGKDIHPAILTLGIQLRDHVICGSSARCVAMLLVFKRLIQDYDTPPGVALSRHLTSHLSAQISFLSRARPLGVAQGNAIRWLKKVISAVDPGMGDSEAKRAILEMIDAFVRERVVLAGEVISRDGAGRIKDGDTIVTFGKSSVIEKTLIQAHEEGKKSFNVVVVDSRPLFEGRNLARSLGKRGIETKYVLLSGLAEALRQGSITKCFLGASAIFGNGRLYSRAGTAMLAMMCKEASVKLPVIVLCESIKFTGRVALDSVLMNEVADANTLVESEEDEILARIAPPIEPVSSKGGKTGAGGGKDEEEQPDNMKRKGLEGWRDRHNLQLLNLMYDVTPVEYLDMVITELGSMPPSAVPVVIGVHGGEE